MQVADQAGLQPGILRRDASRQPGADAEQVADIAVQALLLEVEAWPKPGLVSRVDNGSHADMDVDMMRCSARCLRPFFAQLVEAGRTGADMAALRVIGLRAERRMLAVTGGVNTHRGGIFGLGLLCAAAGAGSLSTGGHLGARVRQRWGADILAGPVSTDSHGFKVARRYGAGGARSEAAAGFPGVYDVGLPALRQARSLEIEDPDAVAVHVCMALIARIEDTNLYHRGGLEGVQHATGRARAFMAAGGVAATDWRQRAVLMHRSFVARNLSPGGSADLLAMTLFVDMIGQGQILHD